MTLIDAAALRIDPESWIPQNDEWVREVGPFDELLREQGEDVDDLRGLGFSKSAVWHHRGVPWHKAPAPPRWHRHFAQTYGAVDLRQFFRCPCGAMADNVHQRWTLLDPPRVRGWLAR